VLLPGSVDAGRDANRIKPSVVPYTSTWRIAPGVYVAPGEVLDACLPELAADRQTKTPKDGP
jgi:hypothetical protein